MILLLFATLLGSIVFHAAALRDGAAAVRRPSLTAGAHELADPLRRLQPAAGQDHDRRLLGADDAGVEEPGQCRSRDGGGGLDVEPPAGELAPSGLDLALPRPPPSARPLRDPAALPFKLRPPRQDIDLAVPFRSEAASPPTIVAEIAHYRERRPRPPRPRAHDETPARQRLATGVDTNLLEPGPPHRHPRSANQGFIWRPGFLR